MSRHEEIPLVSRYEDAAMSSFDRKSGAAHNVWLQELGEMEEEGDHRFNRHRAPLFERAKKPHVFTADQRKRMDGYESIDFFEAQSLIYKDHLRAVKSEPRWVKWAVYVAVGMSTGLWACVLFQTLDFLSNARRSVVETIVNNRNDEKGTTGVGVHLTTSGIRMDAFLYGYGTMLLWAIVGCLLSSLCCLIMPSAAGSGVPDVMAYLNGVMFPLIFNVRTLVVKTASCILAVSSGLPGGVEGPMIHIGALIGAGLPSGRSRSMGFSNRFLSMFRNAKDTRDFITAGAACGITSAFSSPIGGLLFVMEEVATFFPVKLSWMVFVSALACMCTMQLVNTYLQGWKYNSFAPADGNFADTAITMFRTQFQEFHSIPLNILTFVPTIVTGIALGLLSVVFVLGNQRVNRFRARNIFPKPLFRVLEPALFVSVYMSCCYLVPLAFSCKPIPPMIKENAETLGIELWTAFCPDRENEFHPLATLTLTNSYNVIRSLFVRNAADLFPWHALLIYQAIYTIGAMYGGGMFTSIGVVIPTIVMGAIGGRLLGVAFNEPTWADPGVISLVGAAAYFGGLSRLTFSLVVIMMEITNDLTHMSCMMVGIIIAKTVADQFCHSLYHSILEMKCVPFLPVANSLHKLDTYSAKDIMTEKVVILKTIESFQRIVEVLRTTKHNCFPVVSVADGKRYRGLLQRKQLELLLWYIYFRDTDPCTRTVSTGFYSSNSLTPMQLKEHASYADLKKVEDRIYWERLAAIPNVESLPAETTTAFVDLNPYVDVAALYVRDVMCLSRAYSMFQNMALRHLPVLNRHNFVVGIITRKNFVEDRMHERIDAAAMKSKEAKRSSSIKRRQAHPREE
ncbi:chloride channel protein, putative [Bodo saltans]|uniref:Chloride channel protein n=1 Tax=Bodo saltans TaxID=75058 RepID=A0A0S4JG93_BODSA|nr:chloride channel protein, putative [Bodo saltans]|eukprot:CUG89156.1 chloride channel protein, putative [Bodo saltans]